MIPRKRLHKQSDSVPQAKQPHGTEDDPHHDAPAPTPCAGGASGHSRPVPCTFSLLITDLDQGALTTLLAWLSPANDDRAPDQGTRCVYPHCGHSHGGYEPRASAVLDGLTLATLAIAEAKRLVEAEVLP